MQLDLGAKESLWAVEVGSQNILKKREYFVL